MLRLLNAFKHILFFCILTILTQVGGIVYLLSVWVAGKLPDKIRFKTVYVFVLIYTSATFLIVPVLAPFGGRVKVSTNENLKPASPITTLFNRNYVTPELNSQLLHLSNNSKLTQPSIQVRYLDACFPFLNQFPLLPHLSHYDGNKIDLSLVYENKQGEIVNKSKSISGYGVFEGPKENEFDQTAYCKKEGYFQYDYPKYLTLGKINKQLQFSEFGTRLLLEAILDSPGFGKIFIEPHLKERLGVHDKRIRFQGCRAVRHDDHIHIQL